MTKNQDSNPWCRNQNRPDLAFCRAALSTLAALALICPSLAEPPDLTAPNPDMTLVNDPFNLGPTGMKGRMYSEHIDTSMTRQILVTTVDAGSPAAGILAPNDVILGADGTGANPALFSSDARVALAMAIGDAEANSPATLKLLRWRAGVTETVAITLQTLGAYSSTAPYNCAKSAAILEQGLQDIMDHQTGGTGP